MPIRQRISADDRSMRWSRELTPCQRLAIVRGYEKRMQERRPVYSEDFKWLDHNRALLNIAPQGPVG